VCVTEWSRLKTQGEEEIKNGKKKKKEKSRREG
jgi:hypothetical protein